MPACATKMGTEIKSVKRKNLSWLNKTLHMLIYIANMAFISGPAAVNSGALKQLKLNRLGPFSRFKVKLAY